MRALHLLFFSVFSLLMIACETVVKKNVSPTEIIANKIADDHSYANCKEIHTKHLHLELDVNFENQTIYGVARHEMINNGTDTAIFDIKGLEIQKITLGKKGFEKEASFMIGKWDKDSILGQPLLVTIKRTTQHINIYYKTTELTQAIDWLNPSLTSGKVHPFMYTQGQAILTRTWIPLQDSPANRITYSADVKVPIDLMAVMSAKNPHHKTKDGIYHFEMKQAIPCYLIALAVGDLSYRKLGINSGVYAEPQLLAKASYEFADLPKMITTAENLYGPYKWEQYDLLVLPYSFPYGGMENPRLTFVNPTLLVGDRSLVSVIAHELAHSWSGNLVTNSSWDDFWLNEGFTVYFENRIMEQLYSKEIADMLAIIEFQELESTISKMDKSEHPEDSRLKLNLTNRDPEDGLTDIAYVKGAFFLKTIEQKVGRKRFDQFLNKYFQNFSFKTVNTEQFKAYLNAQLLLPNKLTFNTSEWLYQKGLPKNCIQLYSQRFEKITQLARKFSAGENIFKKKVSWVKIKGKRRKKKLVYQLKRSDFIAQEWQVFIRQLPKKMAVEQLKLVDRELNFKNWGNAEIMEEWFVLGIRSNYKEVFPAMEKFISKVGRRKFLLPIYSTLAEQERTKKWALGVYKKAKINYHPITQKSIEELIY